MNNNNDNSDMWDWQSEVYCLEENTSLEISECLLGGENKNDNHLGYLFNDEATPIKDCGDLAYQVPCTGKELEQYPDRSSQAKRRRLQFEPDDMDISLYHDDSFLRSQETQDSLEEDDIMEISQWVSGFSEEESGVSNLCLDPSSEGWINDCIGDSNLHFSNEDPSSTSGASDIQIDISDFCCNTPEFDANNVVNKQPVNTRRNVVFKGTKSYMHMPPKLACSVVKPFAFIKPCGADGDLTLKDINKRILTPPPKPKQHEDPSLSYPRSAFSGKPVVGKTKIHTEGGKGSITIMRTKG